MKDRIEDHDSAATDRPREWAKPELAVIPMSEAMASPIPNQLSVDQPFGYS
jgi:hypothetical protein